MENPRILYTGPLRDFSGYASVARDYVLALHKSGQDVATRDLRYDAGNYKRTKLENELAAKPLGDVKIIIQHTTPNEMEYKSGYFNVGVFCWETDRIPLEWVNQLNQMDLIIVSSSQNIDAVIKSGVIVPVVKLPYATNVDKYEEDIKPLSLPQIKGKFKFLSIFQYSKKKAFDALLKAYLSEFSPEDSVCLVVKTYIGSNDTPEQKKQLASLVDAMKGLLRLKSYPPILMIHEVLSFDEMKALYRASDCYVLPSRGEGWGVPHLDALGYGLPAIATKGTGPEEFITDKCGWLVDSHASPVLDMPHPFDYLYTAKDRWREPHVGDLMDTMRDAHSLYKYNPNGWSAKCDAARLRAQNFSHEVVGSRLSKVLMSNYYAWKENRELVCSST